MKSTLKIIVACLMLSFLTGCGSLSLFSDRHVHYHGNPDTDKKVADLEKRVETLERQATTNQPKQP